MSKTVRCVRVANILHRGGTFWEPDAWFRQDRIPEWKSAPIQEVDRDFVPFRQKDPEKKEPRLKVPYVLPASEHYDNPEHHVVFASELLDKALERQSLPNYRRGRGQSSDRKMRFLNDDGDLALNMAMRPAEVFEVLANPEEIARKHARWLTSMAKNGHVERYRGSSIEVRGAGGAWVTTAYAKPISSRPLLAQFKPEFLTPDEDDDTKLLFNRDWFHIRAVLGLTDSEWYAWELMQDGYTAAEIKRFAKPLSPAERSPLVDRAAELGMKLGNQTASATLLYLERKLADAREHFSGSPARRSKGPRYRNEFMLGLSAYRSTGRARTAAFSDRGYAIRHSARTEISTTIAIRPQVDGLTPAERFSLGLSTYLATAQHPRGLYEAVIVFAASWTESHEFRLVFRPLVRCPELDEIDELFPAQDQYPGLLLRMLNEPNTVPSLLNAA